MKAFISIDMEGICGIVREIETDPTKGGEAYQQSRRLMTQEGNAAIEGCLKAGATEVLIADSHWNFDNLIQEELHEAATLLRETPRGFAIALSAVTNCNLIRPRHVSENQKRCSSAIWAGGRVPSQKSMEPGVVEAAGPSLQIPILGTLPITTIRSRAPGSGGGNYLPQKVHFWSEELWERLPPLCNRL